MRSKLCETFPESIEDSVGIWQIGHDQVDREQLLFCCMSSCRAGAPDALNGKTKEGEQEGASQPGHVPAAQLVPLHCNQNLLLQTERGE